MECAMEKSANFGADLEKYYRIELGSPRPSWRRRVKFWITNLGFHCVAAYRLSRFQRGLRARGNPVAYLLLPISEAMCFMSRFLHHVDIFAASIGPGFYIGHVGTIYVGRTEIGDNFSVTHNVTVGMGASGGTRKHPVLGNNVWIGCGSVLYGNILIGDGVTVNCGSILSRNVPDRCLVGGNPARVLLQNYDNSALFSGMIGKPPGTGTGPGDGASPEDSVPEGDTAAPPAQAAPAADDPAASQAVFVIPEKPVSNGQDALDPNGTEGASGRRKVEAGTP
jgi:serine O-acetyltransferase